MRSARADGEGGYALVAAVASIAVFALMALTLLRAAHGSILSAEGEIDRVKANAAAHAGLALAIQGLLAPDRTSRWSIDGRTRMVTFGNASLAIRIEDERGKIPIGVIDDDQAKRLFENLGLVGERRTIASDSLLDWIDDDDIERPNGAESLYYIKRGIRPRNGVPLSIEELGLIRGFDAALVERLRPIVTVFFGRGAFDARFAPPGAIAIMAEGGENSPAIIERERELAGQRPAIELGEDVSLVGRPLTVAVDARLANGAEAHRRTVIELTGAARARYIVRAVE